MQPSSPPNDYIDLRQYWYILKRRWLPLVVVTGSVIGATITLTSWQQPLYESSGKLRFNKDNRVSALSGLSEQMGEMSGVTNLSNPLETEAEIIRSTPLVQKTIDALNLKGDDNENLTPKYFLQRLKVKSLRGTDVLAISYVHHDPKLAADIVNTLINTYLENNIRVNRTEAVAAREFITRQLPEVEARVSAAEGSLRQFKEQNNVVALEEEAKVMVAGLNDLSKQVTSTSAALGEANSRSVSLQKQLGLTAQQAIALTSVSQSAAVQEVMAQSRKIQDELALQRTRYQEEHPAIAELTAKETALQQQLQQRINETLGTTTTLSPQNLQMGALKQEITADLVKIEAERLGLSNRIQILNQAINASQQRAVTLPQLEQSQRELERRLQLARSTYEQLLKRLQEVQVVENQSVGNAQIVSPADTPENPISPRVLLNLMLGSFTALFLAILIAGLLESIDRSVKTSDEAQQLLQYPLLGEVPRILDKTGQPIPLPLWDQVYSPASMAFEMLQTTLGFTVSDKSLKVIAVSSALPGEGKSFVAGNLAIAVAQTGKRVLLIDGDMRCPTQHKNWEIPNLKGFSDVLVGQAEYQNIITKAMANLHILTSGTMPPNPSTLLNSQRLLEIIERVSQDYDFIIIDTPPVTVVADGLLLGKAADGMLMVARPGIATSTALTNAKKVLTQSGEVVLGVVINGTVMKSGYGGYYSYGNPYRMSQSAELAELEHLLPRMNSSKKRSSSVKK
jgi:polysaccharide biosynthesis transport protein